MGRTPHHSDGEYPGRQARTGSWWRARGEILRRFALADLDPESQGWILKTDLFDEASGPHHHAVEVPEGVRWLGIDVDAAVARDAARRLRAENVSARIVVCDVRALPFASGSIKGIMSLSTLDHFTEADQIRVSLVELARVLGDGGWLRLTLDNPHNPEVALRRWLPEPLVARLRSDHFFIGETLAMQELTALLEEMGFSVQKTSYVLHAPRTPLVRLGRWLGDLGRPRAEAALQQLVLACEDLERLPARRWTGHYVACAARRSYEMQSEVDYSTKQSTDVGKGATAQ